MTGSRPFLRRLAPVSAALAIAAVTALSGCERAAPAPPPRPEAPPAAPAQPTDAKVLRDEVEAMAKRCEVDLKRSIISRCPDDELTRLHASFAAGNRDRGALLDTWSALLADPSPQTATVAASAVGAAMRTLSNDGAVPAVSTATADALIATLSDLPKFQAVHATPGITHAAAIAGRVEHLFEVASAHPAADAIKPVIALHVARYGRLEGLQFLQRWMRDSANDRFRAACVAGPRALVDARADERATMCTWVQQQSTDARASIRIEAGNTLIWCGEPHISALLDGIARAIDARTLDKNMPTMLAGLCPLPAAARGGEAPAPRPGCERALSLLEQAVRTEGVPSQTRSRALLTLSRLRPDARTEALARAQSTSSDDLLGPRARSVLKTLTASNASRSADGGAR